MKVLRVSNKTAINAFHELEEFGFIERQNNSKASRSSTIWAFSDKWHRE
jgi:hypothetical protein